MKFDDRKNYRLADGEDNCSVCENTFIFCRKLKCRRAYTEDRAGVPTYRVVDKKHVCDKHKEKAQ